jgi:NhaP-type Na+/H+ or K+/H+ antiporter
VRIADVSWHWPGGYLLFVHVALPPVGATISAARPRPRLKGRREGWSAKETHMSGSPVPVNDLLPTGVGLVVLLLLVGSTVAVVVRWIAVPAESLLAVIGLAVGAIIGRGELPSIGGSLILFVLLPGLIFTAGFRLDWRLLRQNLIAVVALATAGVGLTTAVVGVLGHWTLGLTLPFAILLGAMVAPTDPVSVTALLRRLGMPDRLLNLFEAESLVNDGTGVVVFTIALAATATGTFVPTFILLDFARLALGGVGLGVVIGFAISFVTSRIDDARVELSLTAAAAYGGYLLGEMAHVSGILVVVAAAIVLGNVGRPHGMSERTQQAVDVFWDYVAFVLNTAVFVLIGLAVPLRQLVADPGAVALGVVVALVARARVRLPAPATAGAAAAAGSAALAAPAGPWRTARSGGDGARSQPGGRWRRLRAGAGPDVRRGRHVDPPAGSDHRAGRPRPAS